MFLPYQTDAPIYHWPIATVGLIVVNTLVFFGLINADLGQLAPWILQWGEGWHPVQWVTSNFLHAGLAHLLGNMICLWGFGLVVEGKIGWWRFLAAYVGIGVLQNVIEQTVMLGASHGGSLGASGAIFGVLAMALVWAPKNEMTVATVFWYRLYEFNCSILVLGMAAVGIQVATWMITVHAVGNRLGHAMTSEALHLMGAAIGFALGTIMLKRGWVDCENWDLYSVLAGRHRMSDEKLTDLRQQTAEWQENQQKRRDRALRQIREITSDGRPALAYRAHQKMARTIEDWHLPDRDLLRIIAAFHEQRMWSESVPIMIEYLGTCSEHEPQVRLRLAHILVEKENCPVQALNVMERIRPEMLSEDERDLLNRLRHKAEKLKEQDPYEAAVGDW